MAGRTKLLDLVGVASGRNLAGPLAGHRGGEHRRRLAGTSGAVATAHWDGASSSHHRELRLGAHLVVGGGVVRPTYLWLVRHLRSRTRRAAARQVMDPAGFDRAEQLCRADPLVTTAMRQRVIRLLTYIVMAKGGTLTDITVGDLLDLLEYEQTAHPKVHAAALTYRVLRDLGVFPVDTPPSLRAARTTGPRSSADLVERYQIACHPIRDLLIDYLTERTKGQDYSNLRQLVTMLAGNFWADLERHHPGITSLDLPHEVAAAWKQRLRHVRDRDGRIVRERAAVKDILINVRSLYLDLAQWAVEEPSRWGPWVAPCPISAAETNTRKTSRTARPAWTSAPETGCPCCPPWCAPPTQRKHSTRQLRDAALATPPGELFTVGRTRVPATAAARQQTLNRIWADRPRHRRAPRPGAPRKNTAFWAWAAIEVLRHTGVRIEELLELTHHGFVTYALPSTGELVPLLQIAPSKTDNERMLVVSPNWPTCSPPSSTGSADGRRHPAARVRLRQR